MSDVLSLTQYEEHIYNSHLRISRQQKGQPYKLRKQFENIDDKTKVYLKKLSLFFKKFEHIKVDDFFIAPYKLYPDETYFDLEYFTTLKATKAFSLYQKKILFDDPDSEDQLKNIVEALHFISQFCKDKNIPLASYLEYTDDSIPSFLIHLKEHRTNVFTLLAFTDFRKMLNTVDVETVRFILGDELYNNIDLFRAKLYKSQKAHLLIQKGLQRIETSQNKNS